MNFTIIISTVVWILPPFKQYKSDFFYFFLILAFTDPLTIIGVYLLGISPHYVQTALGILLISSLVYRPKHRYFFVILSILTFVVFLSFSLQRNITHLTLIATHFIIVSFLILYFMKYVQEKKAINLFLVFLVTYEFINVIKLIASSLSYEHGVISFYLATTTQIFFGIIFMFITIKTKDFPLIIKK